MTKMIRVYCKGTSKESYAWWVLPVDQYGICRAVGGFRFWYPIP